MPDMYLKAFSVCVVGAGALGCAVLEKLAGAGIGRVRVVDGDIVTPKNLKNQPLYGESDTKNPTFKALAAVKALRSAHKGTEFVASAFYIGSKRAGKALFGYDMVIDATDNRESRLIINETCLNNRVPLMIASINGKKGLFYIINGKSACFGCIAANARKPVNEECVNISRKDAERLAEMMVTGMLRFFESPSQLQQFTSVNLATNATESQQLLKYAGCQTCGPRRRRRSRDGAVVQLCGDGIKASIQRRISLNKLSAGIPGFVRDGKADFALLRKDGKSVLVSFEGDVLFTGYGEDEACALLNKIRRAVHAASRTS